MSARTWQIITFTALIVWGVALIVSAPIAVKAVACVTGFYALYAWNRAEDKETSAAILRAIQLAQSTRRNNP